MLLNILRVRILLSMGVGVYKFIYMRTIKIGDKLIGKSKQVFIIAEAGVNHNGKEKLALKLVDEAYEAGADAVKFQTFEANQVVIESAPMAEYQVKNLGIRESQFAMIKKLELSKNAHRAVAEHCRKRGILFLSTPHGGFESVDFLSKLGVPAFKIGSGDLTNLPLLAYAAKFKKPMIISTGMAKLKEVKEAIRCIRDKGNHKIIVLQCTTNYPCSLDEVNLRAMPAMGKELNVPVGYSDHTLGTHVAVMAAILGACMIEKHFTLDKKMSGPDHVASLDPGELKEMVRQIRSVPLVLGNSLKKPAKSEKQYIPLVRKSIVSEKDIFCGEIFTKSNISIKRPGTGIAPRYFDKILGKKAKRDIKRDRLLLKNDY